MDKAARKAYMKAYRKANKERLAAQARERWQNVKRVQLIDNGNVDTLILTREQVRSIVAAWLKEHTGV